MRRGWMLGALAFAAGATLAWQLYHGQRDALPAGLASGNGRLEAVEVDIAARLPGRLASVRVHEGDDVAAGEIIATQDSDDLNAQLRGARAQIEQAARLIDTEQAGLAKSTTQEKLSEQTLRRTQNLFARGFITRDKLDHDQQEHDSATAASNEARSKVAQARAALEAARARLDAVQVSLADTALKAPRAGRVLYRLAEPGEVIPSGGKVATLLDLSDVSLAIYLPARQAGRLAVKDDAVIVLDALPARPIPAFVAYVSPRAQFTPKEVETRDEREKLMFRVKLQVSPEWIARHGALAKPGMPGVGYVRTEAHTAWPAHLQPTLDSRAAP